MVRGQPRPIQNARRASRIAASSAAAVLVAGGILFAGAAPASASTSTTTFSVPGGPYSFVVPQGVTSIEVEALGGSGDSWSDYYDSYVGGAGADVSADLTVTAGATYYVYVGGNGTSTAGGTHGGGAPAPDDRGGGGGGSSDFRSTSGDDATRLLVAAGGGGAGVRGVGGPAGSSGTDQFCAVAQPGTLLGPGAGGNGCDGSSGTSGSGSVGGDAGERVSGGDGGGGGGGGYFGGGGGGAYGGGAGGSSYVSAAGANPSISLGAFQAEPSVTVSYTRPIATAISVTAAPGSITADGHATALVTATLTNAFNDPTPGDIVEFSSTDAGQTFGPVTDNGDGTYSATVTSSAAVHSTTITATDTSTASPLHTTTTLVQTADRAAYVALAASPASLIADGNSTSTVTATVTDSLTNPVIGDTLIFSSSDPAQHISSVTDHGDGTYSVTVTASNTVHSTTISASDASSGALPTGTTTLDQTQDTVTHLAIALAPASLTANGHSTSTATITATDVAGYPVLGETITAASTDPGQQIGAVTDNGDGTYSVVITASTRVGRATITATDAAGAAGTATLTSTVVVLASTGTDVSWLAPGVAVALLAVGLTLYLRRRIRPHRA
jgi:hypothetical protein